MMVMCPHIHSKAILMSCTQHTVSLVCAHVSAGRTEAAGKAQSRGSEEDDGGARRGSLRDTMEKSMCSI